MKLEPVTKLDKSNKTMSKNFDDEVMSENCDVIVTFQIFGNLEQFGGRCPDTESAKVMFSVIATICLAKTELKNH